MTSQRTDIPVLLSESLSLFCLQSLRGQIAVAGTSALFVLIAAYLFVLARSVEHLPKSLPWAGRRHEPFSKVRACFREYYKGWTTLKEGQEQYGRNGLPFILPQPTFRSLVILPQEYMKWMLKQPEAILSARVVQWELFGIQYLVPEVVSDVHIHLVNIMINTMRTKLKGSITLLQSRLVDQVIKSVDTQMGFDEAEWKDIGLFDFMTKVTCQTTLRVWVGEAMFQNKAFVEAYNTFTLWFGASSLMMSSWVPPVFSTVIGLLLQIPIKICTYRCNKHVLPVIRKRWEQVEKMKRGLSVADDVPNDFITWNVEAAMAEKYSKTSCPEYLSTHLLLFAVGGIPTAGFVGTNVFMDLLSSDRKFFERIRQEAEEVFGTVTDPTDATLLTKLSYADSAIRESLRFNPFLISFPQRKVIHENGVTLPDGTHLPQNAWIGSSILDIHQDEKNYSHAKDYRPFRFIEANQENAFKAGSESVEKPDTVLVTVGEDFFGFGAGRHTCPGRWLAAAQLKLILAYVTLHYDIKPLACRPANHRMGEVNIPNRHFKIQVRRRSVEAGSTLEKVQERFHEWASSEKCL